MEKTLDITEEQLTDIISSVKAAGKLNLEEIALQIREQEFFITFVDTDQVYYYEEGIYHAHGEQKIRQILYDLLHDSISNHQVMEIIGKIKRATLIDRSSFDTDKEKLAVKNGILNLMTGELTPHTPEFHTISKIPIDYDPEAKAERFLQFLTEVHYPGDIPMVQEWFGFHLWRAYPIEKAMMYVGDGGNGKSTELSVLEKLIGEDNRASESLQQIASNRFSSVMLLGKLANIASEISDEVIKHTAQFKALTGDKDPIRAEAKGKDVFYFHNFAKLTFSANKVPKVYDDTDSFFRRWNIISFPNTFSGTEGDNKNLIAEMTTPESLSGVLNWALIGFRRLRANNWKFSNAKSVEQTRDEYGIRSNPYAAFVSHCVDFIPGLYMDKDKIYEIFQDHCRSHKIIPVSRDTFYRNIKYTIPHDKYHESRPSIGDRKRRLDDFTVRARENWTCENGMDIVENEPQNEEKTGLERYK